MNLLLEVGALGGRQVLPLEVERHLRLDAQHVGLLEAELVDLEEERDLVVERHGIGDRLDRRRPVVDVGLDRGQPDVELLGQGTRFGHLGGPGGDRLDLVLGDQRAAGETPDARMDDAHAEAGALFAAGAAESEAVDDDAVADRHRIGDVAGEADVGVGAAEPLGLAQGEIGQALEARVEHAASGRLGDQLADQVAGVDRGAGGAQGLHEGAAVVHGSLSRRGVRARGHTAGDTDVMVKSSIFSAGTSAVPGLS